MTPIIDLDGRLTVASAEAEAALDRGDTDLARRKHAEAAKILEKSVAGLESDAEKSLALFLAATQYYKGGNYQRALSLGRRVEKRDLPEGVARLLPEFLGNAQRRASEGYSARIHAELKRLWTTADYQGVIGLLRDHPYVFPAKNLATVRAMCCEGLGQYRPAVLFMRDAHKFDPGDPTTLSALTPLPLQLVGEERLGDAWRYVREQVELFPNAVSHSLAAILCYQRARQADGDVQAALFNEQDQYFELAQAEFSRLPPAHQAHPEIRAVMGLGYETKALRLYHSGNESAALQMCESAIQFDPASSNAWAIMGFVRWPAEDAVTALKKAAELGDKSYLPYYYLAYAELTRGNYRLSFEYARKALELGMNQDQETKALLYLWAAISLARLGEPRHEIETLLTKAIQVSPENEQARTAYRQFQAANVPDLPPLAKRDLYYTSRSPSFDRHNVASVIG